MARIAAAGAVFALLSAGIATGPEAQGLVTMHKLSAASLTLARKEDSTKAVAERLAKSPATTMPQTPLPNVTYAVDGVTILAGGAPIGAIGVSGVPGGQLDEECARAALAKIQDRLK